MLDQQCWTMLHPFKRALSRNLPQDSRYNGNVKSLLKINLFLMNVPYSNFVLTEAHQQRLEKLRKELDYIKTDAWKYKPIEDLIGF